MRDLFLHRPSKVHRAAGLVSRGPRVHHHHPDLTKLQGWKSAQAEAELPESGYEQDKLWALRMGLTGADSIEDRSIPTFARGENPHFAGINTFLKAPYVEDVTEVGHYDATVMGAPFDGGATFRPGSVYAVWPSAMNGVSVFSMAVRILIILAICMQPRPQTCPGQAAFQLGGCRPAASLVPTECPSTWVSEEL